VYDVVGIDGNNLTTTLPVAYAMPLAVLMVKFTKSA
jgi:hypothetical protein